MDKQEAPVKASRSGIKPLTPSACILSRGTSSLGLRHKVKINFLKQTPLGRDCSTVPNSCLPIFELAPGAAWDTRAEHHEDIRHLKMELLLFLRPLFPSSPTNSFHMQLGHIWKSAESRSWVTLFKIKTCISITLGVVPLLAQGPSDPPTSFYQHLQKRKWVIIGFSPHLRKKKWKGCCSSLSASWEKTLWAIIYLQTKITSRFQRAA